LPEGWCWASVEQISVVVRGASPRPAGDPKYFGGPIPWITVGSLTADEHPYLYSVTEGLTEAGKEASRWIEPDTLLLTNSGATLGVPKITMIGGCINDGSVALLDLDYPLKLYLHYFLKSQTERLRNINQGAAQPNLNTGIVKAIAVPLCSINEQQTIVTDIVDRFSKIEAAQVAIEHGLLRAARLRQSILKQAFEGKLVPQDPNDEPASVLLEQIRASRSLQEMKGKAPTETRTRKTTVKPK
jgi:type I restriction enzyme S subunit